MVNKITIIGNLGRDPEVKYLQDGRCLASFSVATSERWTDKNTGEKREKTEWHNMTAFGKTAEIIGNFLRKGSKAYFEGKLQTNEYEKDGEKRYSTKIIVNNMVMLDSKSQNQGGNQPQQYQQTAPPPAQPPQGFPQQQYSQAGQPPVQPQQTAQPIDDTDIPF